MSNKLMFHILIILMVQSPILSAMDCKTDLFNFHSSTQTQLPCDMEHDNNDTNSGIKCHHCKFFGCNALSSLPKTVLNINYYVTDEQTENYIGFYSDTPYYKIYHPPKS